MENKDVVVDFMPEEIKVIDFDSLSFTEKWILVSFYALTRGSISLKNYEEGKTSLFKDGDNWVIYKVSNGKAYNPQAFDYILKACDYYIDQQDHKNEMYSIFDLYLDRYYSKERINSYLKDIKEKYNLDDNSLKKSL